MVQPSLNPKPNEHPEIPEQQQDLDFASSDLRLQIDFTWLSPLEY
jgi:hypothetical protein